MLEVIVALIYKHVMNVYSECLLWVLRKLVYN